MWNLLVLAPISVTAVLHGEVRAALHHGRFGLFVTTTDPSPCEVDVRLDVATGFAVTGMTVTLGGGSTFATSLLASSTARYGYQRVDPIGDPALLEHVDHGRGVEHLRLRVSPVQRGVPVRVVLAIQAGAAAGRVSPEQSLLAAWPGRAPVESMLRRRHVAAIPAVPVALARADVDLVAGEHAAALGHCYELAVAKGARIAATAQLVMRVECDGGVRDAQVAIDDADVRACVVDDVLDWRLAATDTAAIVRYTLALRQWTSKRDTSSSVASTATRASSSSTASL